ncbi:DoxX family protein [Ammoniphilus sp. YIM 78166]|uniref:DoxX family protein n=1 Tax=Ammoniphilus sp. YIM 78166 TaxID=1644106 RepID=UPI00106F97BF|nr:DoxX family protein [Ammoniphilus sp. YIM 78166]
MSKNMEIALFVIRITLGIVFFAHGLQKVQGVEGIVGFFGSLGLPGFMAYAVAGIELIGGLILILGLGTRVVSGLFILIMLGAIFKVKLSAGFLGGYELDFALLGMALALAISGNKLWSLDQYIRRQEIQVETK